VKIQDEIETLIRAGLPNSTFFHGRNAGSGGGHGDCAAPPKKLFEWYYSTGIVPEEHRFSRKSRNPATEDPLAALDQVIEQVEPAIFLFKDFHPFLKPNNFAVIRKLKEIALHLEKQPQNDHSGFVHVGSARRIGEGGDGSELPVTGP